MGYEAAWIYTRQKISGNPEHPRRPAQPVRRHLFPRAPGMGPGRIFCPVLQPRGSEGKGDDFAHVWGRMGTVDYVNLMDFLDECLRTYPNIDEKRLGVTGGSYGGYMTNWIIGHTDRFKCACTQRSIANWITSEYVSNQGYYWTINNLWTETLQDIDTIWDQSPLKYGKNFKTPTLIIHSNHDFGCTLDEGMQMYHALKRAGTETKMCIFRGEGHELSRSGRPKPRLARFEEILSWMDEHLK